MKARTRVAWLGLAVLATGAGSSAHAAPRSAAPHNAPRVTVQRGPYRRSARFIVTDAGHGTWTTSYHSRPPNPGGAPDDNTARDSSRQAWAERFRAPLTVTTCRAQTRCPPTALSGASGTSSGQGVIDHVHTDGLYAFDNASERCRVHGTTARGAVLTTTLTVSRRRRSVTLAVSDPLASLLAVFPSGCPHRGDSLDGLRDNYYMPGFSFAAAWGYDRWFTARPVTLSLSTLHRARRIVVTLGPTPAGRPPGNCAATDPSVQGCRTGGAWSGVLTLVRTP